MQLRVSSLPPATTTTIAYERSGRAATAQRHARQAGRGRQNDRHRAARAWRGIRVDYATALDAERLTQAIESGAYDPEGCVLVTEVEPDSDAWQAGVRPGMFISHVGGKRVTTPDEFRAAVRNVGERFDIRLTQPARHRRNDAEPIDNNPR